MITYESSNIESHNQESAMHWLKSNAASILRYLGGFSVLLSALIYMIQGLQGVDESLRNWIYPAVMAVMIGGGIASQSIFQDARGARLFFALASMLVPVQITQLSAVLTSFVEPASLSSIYEFIACGLLSIIIGSIASYLSLSIFARPKAKPLVLSYFILNCLLMLPFRDALSVAIITGAMFSILAFVYLSVLKSEGRYKLFEGIAIHSMLILPIAIVLVRSSFHVSEFFGVCSLTLIFSVAMWIATNYFLAHKWLKRIALLNSYSMAMFASIGAVFEFTYGNSAIFEASTNVIAYGMAIPSIAIALFCAHCKVDEKIYRTLAISPLIILCARVIFLSTGDFFTLMVVSASVALLGFIIRSRALVTCSALVATLSLVVALINIFDVLGAISWSSMAIVGVGLMCMSTIFERYGRVFFGLLRKKTGEFKAWSY